MDNELASFGRALVGFLALAASVVACAAAIGAV